MSELSFLEGSDILLISLFFIPIFNENTEVLEDEAFSLPHATVCSGSIYRKETLIPKILSEDYDNLPSFFVSVGFTDSVIPKRFLKVSKTS